MSVLQRRLVSRSQIEVFQPTSHRPFGNLSGYRNQTELWGYHWKERRLSCPTGRLSQDTTRLRGMLKKAASGVLALLPCSRTMSTLRASKGLRPCWIDPSERLRACFFEHSLPLTMWGSSGACIGYWRELFNSPLRYPCLFGPLKGPLGNFGCSLSRWSSSLFCYPDGVPTGGLIVF